MCSYYTIFHRPPGSIVIVIPLFIAIGPIDIVFSEAGTVKLASTCCELPYKRSAVILLPSAIAMLEPDSVSNSFTLILLICAPIYQYHTYLNLRYYIPNYYYTCTACLTICRGLSTASASATSSKKPLGRNPSHMPPKSPQARARDIAKRESCVLLLGVTHLPPGMPAMDSSSSRNESVFRPLKLISSRSLLWCCTSSSPRRWRGCLPGR